MKPYVSIIIPTKNAGDKFDLVLKGIFASKAPFSYEVIVVDSGSTDGTKDLVRSYSIKLVETDPSSFSHGGSRNIGADLAEGDILAYLSQDAVPENNDWLTSLTAGFEDPEVAAVFGRQIPNKGASALEVFFLNYVYPDHRIIKDSVDPRNCALQDILFSDVFSAIRRSEWQVSRFDEGLIMSEDQAWSKNILMKKKKIVYEPAAAVYHSHDYTIRRLVMRNFDSGLSLQGIVNAAPGRNLLLEGRYIKARCRIFTKISCTDILLYSPFTNFFDYWVLWPAGIVAGYLCG